MPLEEGKNPLKTIIDILKKELVEIEPIDTEKLEKYKVAKEKIVTDIFELGNMKEIFVDTNIDKQLLSEFIELLDVLKTNRFVTLTTDQIINIKNNYFFNELISVLDKKIKELEPDPEYDKIDRKNQEIKELIELLERETTVLHNSILEKVYELIRKYDSLKNQSLTIFKNLIVYINSLSYKGKITTNTEIPKLTEQELEKIFEKYGYDYKKVPKKLKSLLLLRGNLENIENMFKILPEYGILFKENDKYCIALLIKSNEEILKKIKEISLYYGLDFARAWKNFPIIFFSKSKDEERVLRNQDRFEQNISISSAFEDFCANIEIIESLGYDVREGMQKTMTVFASSNKRIRYNVELLRKYGIIKNNNLAATGFSLSGLKSPNMQEMIDIFIELDELDYIRDNSSRLIIDKNSPIIKRLYFAKKYGYTTDHIKRTKGGKLILTGLIASSTESPIDKLIDKKSVTNYIFDQEQDEKINYHLRIILRNIIPNDEKNNDIDHLDEAYIRDNYTYGFNGVIISSRKVKTIYPILLQEYPELDKKKLLLFAITYNTMMSHEEFEYIRHAVNTKEKKIWII